MRRMEEPTEAQHWREKGSSGLSRRELLAVACFASFPLTNVSSVLARAAPPTTACQHDGGSSWDAERYHDLRVDDVFGVGGQQLKSIRFVGDTVEISDASTPSIIRPADAPADNVYSLTIDARRMDMKGSIALSNAKVSLIGHEANLFDTFSVQLTRDPSNDQSELSITVVNLHIQGDEFFKPLALYTDAQGRLPKLKINVRNVYVNGSRLPTSAASARLWALVGASDELDHPPDDGSVEIHTGANANTDIASAFSSKAMWPAEVYAKALRLHAGKPFDCATQAAILKYANETRAVLASGSLTEAAAGFPLLAARVTANLDAFGHGPNWAPRKSLQKQLLDLKSRMDDFATGSLVADLIELISESFDRKPLDKNKLKNLLAKRDESVTTLDDLDTQIDSNLSETNQHKIEFENINQSMQIVEGHIRRSSLDDLKKANDAASAKAGFTVVGTVVGVAASFYVGPVAGAAIATGLQTVGNIVYAHNTSGITVKTVAEIIKEGQDFYSGMEKLLTQWGQVKRQKDIYIQVHSGERVLQGASPAAGQPDTRKPYTETQAALGLGNSVLDFGKAFVAIAGNLKVTVPQPLTLSQKEELDPELQELLERLSSVQKRQSELLGELQGLIAKKTSIVADKTEMEEAISRLVAINPVNDLQYAQWTDRARYVWLSQVRQIVLDVYILQRAFFFETGRELPIRNDVLTFPASLASLFDASAFDVLAPGKFVTSKDVKAHLQEQRRRMTVAGRSVLLAAETGLDDYLSRSQQKIPFSRAATFSSDDPDSNKTAFIESLNAQIKLLIYRNQLGYQTLPTRVLPSGIVEGSPAALERVSTRPSFIPLYIPYMLRTGGFSNESPLRFFRARVRSVDWETGGKDVGVDGIDFIIIHPGYGEVVAQGQRKLFDLRENDALNEIRQTTTAVMLRDRGNVRDVAIPNVVGGDYYTYYPAVTDYFMAIQVETRNWDHVPQVRNLTIAWEIFS